MAPTNDGTSNGHQSLMNIITTFKPNSQSTKLVKPRYCAFNNPTKNAQATAMVRITFGQQSYDASVFEFTSMKLTVISSITLHNFRLRTWPANFPTNLWNPVDERQQLGNITLISSRQSNCQWHSLSITDYMMLTARFPSIRGVRTSFF